MSTSTTPYALTREHDVVFPMKVVVQSLRVVVQNQLIGDKYAQAMLIELEELNEARLYALDHL